MQNLSHDNLKKGEFQEETGGQNLSSQNENLQFQMGKLEPMRQLASIQFL